MVRPAVARWLPCTHSPAADTVAVWYSFGLPLPMSIPRYNPQPPLPRDPPHPLWLAAAWSSDRAAGRMAGRISSKSKTFRALALFRSR